jgi:hypothetical protein
VPPNSEPHTAPGKGLSAPDSSSRRNTIVRTTQERLPRVLKSNRASIRPSSLEEAIRQFGNRLKRDFGGELARDPTIFKKQVVRLIRRELPPRPGRPNDPRLDAAVRMLEQGKSSKDVLRSQIPNFDEMDTYGRYLAEKGLRAALARRRESRRHHRH